MLDVVVYPHVRVALILVVVELGIVAVLAFVGGVAGLPFSVPVGVEVEMSCGGCGGEGC